MLLETLATTGEYPRASRTGNVSSVPEPTTALIVPAPNPAATTAITSSADTAPMIPDRKPGPREE